MLFAFITIFQKPRFCFKTCISYVWWNLHLGLAYDYLKKFDIAKKAESYFSSNYDCITVDGVRVKFDGGWGLVRASNTQPVIVCRFEGNTPGKMSEIQELMLNKLNEFGNLKASSH